MVHCDNNYIVVSGLAKDFLWEVSGCCCDDASLKLGGGPSLNSWTVCFMWKQGVFFFPSVTRIAYSWTYMYFYIHTNTHRDITEWKKLTEPTECLAKGQLRVSLHFSYTLHTWAKRLRSCELCTSAQGFELSCASLLFCHCLLVSPLTLDVLLSQPHRHNTPTLVSQRPCSPIVFHSTSHDPEQHTAGVCSFL